MSTIFRSVTIGSVGEKAKVSTATVRHWEKRKLIPPASRSSDNRRQYSPAEVEIICNFAQRRREGKRKPAAEGGVT